WDEEITGSLREEFFLWFRELEALKSRIAPLKDDTISRLELLAALVGARLRKSIVDALGWTTVKCFYFSDSTTVLTWITKEEIGPFSPVTECKK
ncbi:hypothetical protein AVEN_181323-1, partial [Araneus ventricosus]